MHLYSHAKNQAWDKCNNPLKPEELSTFKKSDQPLNSATVQQGNSATTMEQNYRSNSDTTEQAETDQTVI